MSLAVVGAQWGDEGKGKVVDYLARRADAVVRFQGGNNAGHTLVVDGKQKILHLVPSGALHEGARCYIGSGVVVDPYVLLDEIGALKDAGYLQQDQIRVSSRAHLILEPHRRIEAARENHAGKSQIGTTRRGIGPAYEARASRKGLRVCDLFNEAALAERIDGLLLEWNELLKGLYGEAEVDAGALLSECRELAGRLAPYVSDVADEVEQELARGGRVLFEGAQGTMLDCDHGTFPFVTSSNTVAGAICAGVGVGPTRITEVLAISKAYTTRVGAGPFPTELDNEVGELLRSRGAEFGATTGRPRRCGWLDAVALRYALDRNGATGLAVTKLDVLGGIGAIQICTAYRLDGAETKTVPPLVDQLARCEPVLESHPGWESDLSAASSLEQLPAEARSYLERVVELAGVPLRLVSVGPGRDQTIIIGEPLLA